MSSDLFHFDRETPPFVRPFLHALDRMQEQTAHPPETLAERARTLLRDRWGGTDAAVETTFAHGAISLLADQTNYSNGFALLMPLRQGTAVAVRRAAEGRSRLVFEGSDVEWSLEADPAQPASADAPPMWARTVRRIAEQWGPAGTAVEIAVVSTVPAVCLDAYLAALAVASARALRALHPDLNPGALEPQLPLLRRIVADCTELPYSIAHLIATCAEEASTFVLVDTATHEHLTVETDARETLGWSLLDPGGPLAREGAFYRKRRDQADEAIEQLRENGFAGLESFRELEHRTLPQALDVLPQPLKPIVRHLVTENRRVQKMVAALRRSDWQMVGGLLLMSHASRRDDWQATHERPDFLVDQVEGMTMESMYGASMTGRNGYVVVVGQPFAVPPALDRIVEAFQQRFDATPNTMLL
jgi:galactokinase